MAASRDTNAKLAESRPLTMKSFLVSVYERFYLGRVAPVARRIIVPLFQAPLQQDETATREAGGGEPADLAGLLDERLQRLEEAATTVGSKVLDRLDQVIIWQRHIHATAHQSYVQTYALMHLLNDVYRDQLVKSERYSDPLRLRVTSGKYLSNAYEDGMIEEIFRRIGTSIKYFVEFGVVPQGADNNTTYLLLQGWRGLWIEISPAIVTAAEGSLRHLVQRDRLRVVNARITAENINELFRDAGVPEEFDLLSIDINGNDYWVWKALEGYRPRVVVIEYNTVLGPTVSCAMKYSPDFSSNGTTYFGCSLKALEKLGREKGYSLVGCDHMGSDAYFVRDDLVGDKFLAPFTAENHYEPMRYFLGGVARHGAAFGEFVEV